MRPALLLAAAILLVSCQRAPVSHPPTASPLSPAERLKAEGDALMVAANYPDAIEKYRQAADLESAAIGPRFGLGSAYSFIEKRPEAIVQFRWVLDHTDASSTEHREARRWLLRAGALATPVAAADAGQAEPARALDPSSAGHLVGTTQWPDVTPQRRLISGSLALTGEEPVTQDVKRTRAFRLGDAYEFKEIPAGRYRVVAVIDGTTVWDEKVTVESGKDTTLNLSQSTSPVPVARFAPAT